MMKTIKKMRSIKSKSKSKQLIANNKWIKLQNENKLLRLELEKLKCDFQEIKRNSKSKFIYD